MTANTSGDVVHLMTRSENFDRIQARIIDSAHAIVDLASAELMPKDVAAIEAEVGRILAALGVIRSALPPA